MAYRGPPDAGIYRMMQHRGYQSGLQTAAGVVLEGGMPHNIFAADNDQCMLSAKRNNGSDLSMPQVAEWGKAACSGGGTRYTDAQRNIVSEAFSANGARSSTSGATPDVSIPHSNGRQGCASALSETATVG